MWHMFAAMTLDGLMLGYMTSYFSHIVPEPIRSGLNVGIVLIMGGTGAILGGYFSGYLSDKIPAPKLGIAGFLFITLMLLLTMLAHYQPYYTLFYPCVLGFLWGLSIYFL
jgi:predicted MFS family arabinose efflux permease